MESSMAETLFTWNTGYSADSVEWCPVTLYHHIFVCGTYQLFKDEEQNTEGTTGKSNQKRLGKLYLFHIFKEMETLEPIQTIETSAILDQKWCSHPIDYSPHLAVANAAGFVQIYKLKADSCLLEFVCEQEINTESKPLALSLDWSTRKVNSELPKLVVSDSSGSITVFQVNSGKELSKLFTWTPHDYEAWICSFDCWNPTIIYTGSDDCTLKMFDLRCGYDNSKIINRTHGAGVTSLHFNTVRENLFASGSYDENLRLWDTRKMKNPIIEEALGGGIWRLKWNPIRNDLLLAACMYGGFRIIDCNQGSSAKVVLEYNEHKSIAYGGDWCYAPSQIVDIEQDSSNIIATCSFYDCKLDLVKIKD